MTPPVVEPPSTPEHEPVKVAIHTLSEEREHDIELAETRYIVNKPLIESMPERTTNASRQSTITSSNARVINAILIVLMLISAIFSYVGTGMASQSGLSYKGLI